MTIRQVKVTPVTMIKNLFTNWKTTSAGVALVVTGLVHLGFAIKNRMITETDMTATLMSVITGAGLVAAGDAGVDKEKPEDKAP